MYVFLCKNFKCLLKSSGFIKLTPFLENSCSNCRFLLDVFLSIYFGTLVCRHNLERKVLGICFCGFFSLSSFSMLLSLFSGFVVDSLRCHWPSTEPRQAQSLHRDGFGKTADPSTQPEGILVHRTTSAGFP